MADENNNIEQKISLTYDTNADAVAGEVQQLNTAIDNTTQSQNENTVATQKSEQNLKTFKTQLREANQELLKVSQTFGETSKEAVQAAKKVADLKDQMQFSKELVDNFNPDQKFKALGAATQIATTATSGLVSGMALFGDQSEDTQKTLLKVQAAMAFSDAVSGLSNLGDQWKTLKTVIASSTIVTAANTAATTVATAATKLFGVTAETTAVGFKVLKGAIIATGIGALGIAIVALIQNFDSIKKAILNTIPGLSGIAETIGNIVQSVTDFVGATSEADRQLDLAKSKAKQQLELNKKYLQEHESQLNEVTKKKIEAKNKYLEVVAEEGKATAEFARETNRQIAKADAEAQAEKDKKAKEAQDRIDEKRRQQRAKEKAENERLAKEQLDADMASAKQALDIVNKLKENKETPSEKLQREYEAEKLVLEANNLSTEELTKQHLEKLALIQKESDDKIAADKKAADEKKAEEDKAKKDKEDKDAVEQEERKNQAIANSKANLNNIISGLEATGLAKTKAGQALAKTMALAQIGIDSAVAISKASTLANAEGVAAQLAFPTVPGIGTVARVLSYTSTALSVAANIAKAKQLLSGGGSASGSSSGGGGGNTSNGGGQSATPTVGFQTSSENQIATTISNNQQEQPPIKAFVVSTEVSTAQAIDRNKITANSLGN
jgi:hypothetical protein